MRALDLIAQKRDNQPLSSDEIQFLVSGFSDGTIPDYQAAAWLMAVYLRGMTSEETVALTLAMAQSGQVLDLSDVKANLRAARNLPSLPLIADKHSTGGVGDKTTITVAPLVAACGVPIGKMSGRGLGHTGGTLDKLESIPGFSTAISIEQFKRQLVEVGLVIAGQTHDLAPADGRLYALRDVTATVASIPLIASSIMSKKIAAGADAIVLDVKVGRGAFMQTETEARALAQMMVSIGQQIGRKVSAVIADMNQPLGTTVGNALEVREAVAALHPQGAHYDDEIVVGSDFRAHCLSVSAQLLLLVGQAHSEADARRQLDEAIASGKALEKFCAWIKAQGGDERVAVNPALLAHSTLKADVVAEADGFVSGIDALAVGLSAMRLGAGRQTKSDAVDPAVGIVLHKKIGDRISRGEPLATIHANAEDLLRAECRNLPAAYQFAAQPVAAPAHIHHVITG